MEHIYLFDWYESGTETNFLEEEDIDNCFIFKMINETDTHPLLELQETEEPPPNKINWDRVFENRNINELNLSDGNRMKLYVSALRSVPKYPKISALSKHQHLVGLKVFSAKYPNVLPHENLGPLACIDKQIFEEMKLKYLKEKREYIEWAKILWKKDHHKRAVRLNPIIEMVYEAEFNMKARELKTFPKTYKMAAHITLSNANTKCEMVFKQDLVKVNMASLPKIQIPALTKKKNIARACSIPEPCAKHPCWFFLPNEKNLTDLPLTEIHRELAQYALDNGTQVIFSESALKCLVETDREWYIPISVCQGLNADGDRRNVLIFGSEFSAKRKLGMERSYRAFRHLLERFLIPTSFYFDKQAQEQNADKSEATAATRGSQMMNDMSSDDDDEHLIINEDEPIGDTEDSAVASETQMFDQISMSSGEDSVFLNEAKADKPIGSTSELNLIKEPTVASETKMFDQISQCSGEENMSIYEDTELCDDPTELPAVSEAADASESQRFDQKSICSSEDNMFLNEDTELCDDPTELPAVSEAADASESQRFDQKSICSSEDNMFLNEDTQTCDDPTELPAVSQAIDASKSQIYDQKSMCNGEAKIFINEAASEPTDAREPKMMVVHEQFDVANVPNDDEDDEDDGEYLILNEETEPIDETDVATGSANEVPGDGDKVIGGTNELPGDVKNESNDKGNEVNDEMISRGSEVTVYTKELIANTSEVTASTCKVTAAISELDADTSESISLKKSQNLSKSSDEMKMPGVDDDEHHLKINEVEATLQTIKEPEIKRMRIDKDKQDNYEPIKKEFNDVHIKEADSNQTHPERSIDFCCKDDELIMDSYYDCNCEGKMAELPPPRSFRKWHLRNTKNGDYVDVLVHCSHKMMGQTGEVIVEPIPEFQIELGGCTLSENKLNSMTLSLFLRKNATLLNARIDAVTGDIATVDTMTLEDIMTQHPNAIEEMANTFYEAINQLEGLLPGHYILKHEPAHGANALLYATNVNGDGDKLVLNFDLPVVTDPDEKTEEAPPELCDVLLPYHKFRRIMPCAFTPHRNMLGKPQKKKKAVVKSKPPPQALKWPKKKMFSTKKNHWFNPNI